MKTRYELDFEVRYAVRLTERTARFYRRIQGFSLVVAFVGASAPLATITPYVPTWAGLCGALVALLTGAILVAVRPAERAIQNEMDMKRYRALVTRSRSMTDIEFQKALDEARETDAAEIESLRDVAWNDVAVELGHPPDPLTLQQRIISALA
jgi:hypothetical protein